MSHPTIEALRIARDAAREGRRCDAGRILDELSPDFDRVRIESLVTTHIDTDRRSYVTRVTRFAGNYDENRVVDLARELPAIRSFAPDESIEPRLRFWAQKITNQPGSYGISAVD